MLDSHIPLLTDIIEDGDPAMARQHQHEDNAETSALALSEDDLNERIEQAIDGVMPVIRRQLHQQLLAVLSRDLKP